MWFEHSYARLLIDSHITDQRPEYMAKFDPANYVAMVQTSGVDAAMVYACDHNGNCYYPTRVGHMHAGLAGRDIFGETVGGLRGAGIVPVAYTTVVFHNDAAARHPEWRMRSADGTERHGRYRYCCCNNPEYADFAAAQTAEIAAYPIEGIFIDMTFWPLVCQCPACAAAWGAPFPATIDWDAPEWVRFQRFREDSMAVFARRMSDAARRTRPGISVTCQFSPVLHGWYLGQSPGIAGAGDYASGDFYGSKHQQRLGVKALDAYSAKPPLEFMTSRCVNLYDHTSTKSAAELKLSAATTLAHGGACFFIDAIDPDGTLNPRTYRRLREVLDALDPFRRLLEQYHPRLAARCGVYFSMASMVQPAANGIPVADWQGESSNMSLRDIPAIAEIGGASELLTRMKIPWRVVVETDADWSGLDTLVVCNAAYLSPQEVERMREFVRRGGTLIATGATSLRDREGRSAGDFQLADVFGVSFAGAMSDRMTYLAANGGGELVSAAGDRAPLALATTAEVRARLALPDFPVGDPDHYASIHSNPPGRTTPHVGWSVNAYGGGRAVYIASAVLRHRQAAQREFGAALFGEFIPRPIAADLPESTEITVLESPGRRFLALVNYQDELPNIPLTGREISWRTEPAARVVRVSDGREQAFGYHDGVLTLALPRLDDIEMFIIE